MSEPRAWYIYTLSDPRTGEVRYVGWTTNPRRRLSHHISHAPDERNHKARWIMGLLITGVRPIMTVVETGTGEWAGAERKWIADFRTKGAALTNLTDGGEGVAGWVPTPETRKNISAARRGIAPTVKMLAAIEAQRGQKRSPDAVAKMAAAQRGRKRTDTQRAMQSANLRGRPVSAETRAKLAMAKRGRSPTAETRAKIAATLTGKAPTAAQIAAREAGPTEAQRIAAKKIGEARRGVPLSDSHRTAISEALKGHPTSALTRERIGAANRRHSTTSERQLSLPHE